MSKLVMCDLCGERSSEFTAGQWWVVGRHGSAAPQQHLCSAACLLEFAERTRPDSWKTT